MALLLILLLISSITLQAIQAKVATKANTLGLEDNLLWEKFKLQHVKAYPQREEEEIRKSVFRANLRKIGAHNEREEQGLETWRMAVTEFADLTEEEFTQQMLGGYVRTPQSLGGHAKREAATDLPASVDWREKGETQNTIKKYQNQVRDAQVKVDEESAAKSAAADAKVTADRKAAAMQNALEESRALLETADRQRRSAEQELADTNENLADLGNVNQSIAAAKRKLESEFNQLGGDLDEMTNEARLSEEKAARAMVDAARLADELRCEQDVAMNLEKDKKLLEAQCKDAGARADEAEVNALKGGRKAMIKMETRIRELESELDAETRRNGDICKNLRKSERTIKELPFAGDEDKKNHERMQALIDQLQGKVKSYKKQIEEAEEIAALNLAKYRKVAGALGDT